MVQPLPTIHELQQRIIHLSACIREAQRAGWLTDATELYQERDAVLERLHQLYTP